jgi:hypothetical protein
MVLPPSASRFFRFLILYTGRTPWTGDQPVARPLSTQRTTRTKNKRTQTSMPPVGFELTISVLEQAKKVHALDRVGTAIGFSVNPNRSHCFPSTDHPAVHFLTFSTLLVTVRNRFLRHSSKWASRLQGIRRKGRHVLERYWVLIQAETQSILRLFVVFVRISARLRVLNLGYA